MLKLALTYLKDKLLSERAVVVGGAAALLVALAAKLNIVIDQAALEVVLLPLVTGIATRFLVTSKGVKPGL